MILYGANKELADWVSIGMFGKTEYYEENTKAIGHVKDGKLIAAVIYNNFTCQLDGSFFDAEMSVYSIDKSWATRQYLKAVFSYPFTQLKLERVHTACSAQDEGAIMFNKKVGFKPEGYHRGAWILGGDMISFGMLKGECKWA